MLTIDRAHVKDVFQSYVSDYDLSDVKVRLKVDHTCRVAGLCDAITDDLGLSSEDRDLAWLSGMLHDIGRFEQLRRYHTFVDSRSVNHAALSADILFKGGLISRFVKTSGLQQCAAPVDEEARRDHDSLRILEKSIRLHNVYRLPEKMAGREYLFATILRDADKVDILRVNCETPVTEIYDLPMEAFRKASITDEVLNDVLSHENVNRVHSKTAIDFIIGHIAFVFGLVYKESFRQVRAQGYLTQMMEFPSENPDTQKKLRLIGREVEEYIDRKLAGA